MLTDKGRRAPDSIAVGRPLDVDSARKATATVNGPREGVQGFQRLLGIRPENCLHVGDQFLITGNDYASRSSCPCLWITNPTETKRVLADILAVVDDRRP